jgi:hypothetical protein
LWGFKQKKYKQPLYNTLMRHSCLTLNMVLDDFFSNSSLKNENARYSSVELNPCNIFMAKIGAENKK